MAANVKLVRLVNRDEILAEVVAYDEKGLVVRNPVRIVVLPMDPKLQYDPKKAQSNVGIAPWAEFSEDKEFTIDRAHVLCIMSPVADFLNQYNSIFGGLVIPNKSNLILPGM